MLLASVTVYRGLGPARVGGGPVLGSRMRLVEARDSTSLTGIASCSGVLSSSVDRGVGLWCLGVRRRRVEVGATERGLGKVHGQGGLGRVGGSRRCRRRARTRPQPPLRTRGSIIVAHRHRGKSYPKASNHCNGPSTAAERDKTKILQASPVQPCSW